MAKGHAIDRAIEILQTHNIKNAIVNAGGDLRSIGKKGQKDWKVAIRKPNSEDVVAVIEVKVMNQFSPPVITNAIKNSMAKDTLTLLIQNRIWN